MLLCSHSYAHSERPKQYQYCTATNNAFREFVCTYDSKWGEQYYNNNIIIEAEKLKNK